jgi:hypothetical protein
MYCVNCGVKLADSEEQCPLCGTRVFHPDFDHPDGPPTYPKGKLPATAPRSFLWQSILTVLYLIPILVVPLCDLQLNSRVTWSGFVTGALLLSYIVVVLPCGSARQIP